LEHESSSSISANERRNFFRIEDTVLMRCQTIDENSALANLIPASFKDDPSFSLMHELMEIDRDNNKLLRVISEQSHELESYLKGLSKKLDLIVAKILKPDEQAAHQEQHTISISESGLSFHSPTKYAHDSYLAVHITLLPSHHSLILFTRVINCSANGGDYDIALSFVQLKETDRQVLAKHIMQLQLAQRRQQHGK